MNTESSLAKLVLNTNTSHSISPTSSSSPPPLPLSSNDDHPSNNGNGVHHPDDKFVSSNHYQNGMLADLQTSFQGSSWSHAMDPMSGATGDHPFDVHNSNRMFDPQAMSAASLMAMQQQQQQQLSYQQVKQLERFSDPSRSFRPSSDDRSRPRITFQQQFH